MLNSYVKQLDVGSIKVERPQSEFSDGPPCLESLTQTKLNDGRDRVIYQFIQYAKRKWPEEWPRLKKLPSRWCVEPFGAGKSDNSCLC